MRFKCLTKICVGFTQSHNFTEVYGSANHVRRITKGGGVMKERFAGLFVLCIAIFLSCMHPAFGQATLATAQLSGAVTDSSGGAVAGANVTVHNTDTNTTSTATSNSAGLYVVTNLPPGNYELRVSFSGFANYTQTGIVLTVGQFATANVQLQVESLGEKVVVSTEVPTIEPTKTEISQVVQTQQIESL